uniref:Paired domain-containing protein n=1 Tax=Ascaris lumbricoides TaxID=6252 RepID=A0A0M3HJR2_ASCLU
MDVYRKFCTDTQKQDLFRPHLCLQIGGNPRSRKVLAAVEEHIARLCKECPSINANEIRSCLIERGICSRTNAPTVSAVHKYLRSAALCRTTSRSQKQSLLKHSIEDILNDHHGKQTYSAYSYIL